MQLHEHTRYLWTLSVPWSLPNDQVSRPHGNALLGVSLTFCPESQTRLALQTTSTGNDTAEILTCNKNDERGLSVKLVYWVGFVATRYTFQRFFFWSAPNCSNAIPAQILGQDLSRNLPQVWLRLLSQYAPLYLLSHSQKKHLQCIHLLWNFQLCKHCTMCSAFLPPAAAEESDFLKVSNACLKESLSSKNSELK